MSGCLIEAAGGSRKTANGLLCGFDQARPHEERDARVMAATMDHSSIRALGSAFPHYFAGLPRSESGDHRGGCSLKTFEGSPHRSHASRSWLGLVLLLQLDKRVSCGCFFGRVTQAWTGT